MQKSCQVLNKIVHKILYNNVSAQASCNKHSQHRPTWLTNTGNPLPLGSMKTSVSDYKFIIMILVCFRLSFWQTELELNSITPDILFQVALTTNCSDYPFLHTHMQYIWQANNIPQLCLMHMAYLLLLIVSHYYF